MILAHANSGSKKLRRRLHCLATLLFAALVPTAFAAPVHLRCQYRANPLGIDALTPRLSWQSDSPERDWKQAAYEILVSSSPEKLAANEADIWDSGKIDSSESVDIAYSGPKLESRHRYYWKVRVWASDGRQSESSEAAWWEMGLLHPADWKARWITWRNPEDEADRSGIRWIWVRGQNTLAVPSKAAVQFRTWFDLSAMPREAALYLTARGSFAVRVNGRDAGKKSHWRAFDRRDITDQLVVGKNLVEVRVIAPDASDQASKTAVAALAALIKITTADDLVVRTPTNTDWQACRETKCQWRPARIVGRLTDSRFGDPGTLPQPAAYLRRAFEVTKEITRARLYATSLGSYRVYLNGTRVSAAVLTPGFTDFSKRLQYQTYDVTDLLTRGKNVIGALLGDGWYGSPLTWAGWHFFPAPDRFLVQLELDYSDGTREMLVTDDSWKCAPSPVVRSEIYAGEIYDARLEQPGWNTPGFDDSRWSAALVLAAPSAAISSQVSDPPEVVATLEAKSVRSPAKGTYVFDMGQNMVGWATLKVRGERGSRVRMRFAEILNPDGTIYTANLRSADATDTYVLRGEGEETFAPHFTFHGFRYVEISGYPGVPPLRAIEGEVVSSLRGDPSATLATSSDLVNRMWSIGIWGQRGNFLSVPTDCPQRDERLGWMGDAGVFWRTGSYNFNIAAFSHKFVQDIVDAQEPQGAFTNVSPNTLPPNDEPDPTESSDHIGAPGWGDAGIIIPWTTWLQYGDKAIVEQNWSAMQRWMQFIQSRNPDFLRKRGLGPDYADWLAPDANTNKELLATAYWALITNMMADMARAIGKDADAQRYDELLKNIRAAFQKAYIKDDGQVGTGTQTSYVVALYTNMATPSLEPKMVDKLVADIQARNWHLSTGFLGTPFLLFVLADHGRADVAYRLLLNETYPSWGYMLVKGATTWWERWNGDTGDPAMNSYNHYAFGSVVAWAYRYAAGIDATPEAPGFKKIVIHPHLDPRMTAARAEYESAYGKIVSDWHSTGDGHFDLNVTIPANTSATVFLPQVAGAHVIEDGKTAETEPEGGSLVVQIGSGTYHFEVR
ncbi:MAG TPA: family 78 glycoside hydrolase catalytic domain [Verrucomicrobiae bacterium]|nr:family 78 glycoside hydrolase catalytic domain [Verrucomicrobiae bacterium]